MRTYLFCLLRDRVDPPAGLAGVAGSPVRAIDAGALRAWVEAVPAAPAASADALRRHDAVTNAALQAGTTPLPVRFGEVFDSDDACLASLSARTAELAKLLEQLEGRVEMTLAIPLDAISSPPAQLLEAPDVAPGRAYLERLRAERQPSQILQQQGHVLSRPVINAVRHLVADERATLRISPPTFLVSHLIPRDAVTEYLRLARLAIGGTPGGERTRAVIRGPSAPYSFAVAGP